MATTDADDLAERVAQQLAAVVIAALRPDTAPSETGPDAQVIATAVRRLGDELGLLLRQLEPGCLDGTVPDEDVPSSAVARAARLATHIMLSGHPNATDLS